MKNLLFAGVILALFASCQESPKVNDYLNRQNITAEEYKARVKAEKKRQAELDLPYRTISTDKKIESLVFVTGADQTPEQSVWGNIEKARPDLALFLPDTLAGDTAAYRLVREKLPFMAMWNGGTRNEFLRNWPYVKNLAGPGLYHSYSFGEKKDVLQVIMLNSRLDGENLSLLSDEQWNWLADELRKPAAVSVLVSARSFNEFAREKFLALFKKSKSRNVILLTADSEVSKISKSEHPGVTVYEVSPRSVYTPRVSSGGDTPVQPEKPADYGMLKFDWQGRQARLEVRSAANEDVESMEVKF